MFDPVADMAERWGMEPAHVLRPDLVPGGVSAAVFSSRRGEEIEVSGYLPDHWVLAWHRDGLPHGRARIAGRTPYDGRVGAGTWLLVPPGDRPRARVAGPWEVMHLYLPAPLLAGAAGAVRRASGHLLADRAVSDLLVRFHAEIALRSRPSRIAAEGIGLQIAGALLRRPAAGPRGGSLGGAALARVLAIIEDDPSTDAPALARAAGLSRSHFARLFRAATGQSPRDALGAARLARARDLLEGTDFSVTDVALEAGYADGAHLARDVRARLGTSPSELRRRARRPSRDV